MIQCWAYPLRGLLNSLEFWPCGFSRHVGMAALSSFRRLLPGTCTQKSQHLSTCKRHDADCCTVEFSSAARAHSNALRRLRFSVCSLFFDKGRTVAQRHLNCIPNFHAQRSPLGVPSTHPHLLHPTRFFADKKRFKKFMIQLDSSLSLCFFPIVGWWKETPIMQGHQKFCWRTTKSMQSWGLLAGL